jgi:hypothetical protein
LDHGPLGAIGLVLRVEKLELLVCPGSVVDFGIETVYPLVSALVL